MSWRVISLVIGDQRIYTAGRLREPTQPLDGGNVEYSGEYTTDRDAVEARVAELNATQEEE